MEFVNIKKDVNLSVEQMESIANNFQYLKEKLENAGFYVGTLKNISVYATMDPRDILTQFNNVEHNIQTIHATLLDIFDADEKFYKEFTWEPTTPNRKAEVWRWIDWLLEAKKRACMYEVLYDVNGEQVFDVNDERILVLQESE